MPGRATLTEHLPPAHPAAVAVRHVRTAADCARRIEAMTAPLRDAIAAASYLESGRLAFEVRMAHRRGEVALAEHVPGKFGDAIDRDAAAAGARLAAAARDAVLLVRAAPVLDAPGAGSEEAERAWRARIERVNGAAPVEPPAQPSWTDDTVDLAARLGLGAVEVRVDDAARALAESRGARGVALAGVVHLHPDRVQPGTSEGREVLAHELVHLAQARLPAEHDRGRHAAEHEAGEIARALARGGSALAPVRHIDLARPAADRDADAAEQPLPGLKMMVMVFDAAGAFLGGTATLAADAPAQDSYQADRVGGVWRWQDDAPSMRIGVTIDERGKRSGGQTIEHWVTSKSFAKRAATIRVEFDYPVAYRSEGTGDFDLPSFDGEIGARGAEGGTSTTSATAAATERADSTATSPPGTTASVDRGDTASAAGPTDHGEHAPGAHGAEGGTVGNGRKTGPTSGAAGNMSTTGRRMGERGGEGETTSVVHNDEAERAPGHDANIPNAGGKHDGMAGGEVGSTTHGVAGALGWWGLIDLGKNASAAVAVAAIISDADITGVGQSLFKAARRLGKRTGKLAKEASTLVDHLVERELDHLAQAPEFLARTATEQQALLDAARADLTQAARGRVAQHLDQQIAEYEQMAATYTGDYADDFRSMAKENADRFRDARAALGDVGTTAPQAGVKSSDAATTNAATAADHGQWNDVVGEGPHQGAMQVEQAGEPAHKQRLPREKPIDPGVPTDAANSGFWGGERGNSEWYSDNAAVNRVTNWQPVPYVDNYPDLAQWTQETVYLTKMKGTRADFAPADRELARRRGWLNQDGTPNQNAAKRFRDEKKLSWHHHQDKERMQLVPMALHKNIPHSGGASAARDEAADAMD